MVLEKLCGEDMMTFQRLFCSYSTKYPQGTIVETHTKSKKIYTELKWKICQSPWAQLALPSLTFPLSLIPQLIQTSNSQYVRPLLHPRGKRGEVCLSPQNPQTQQVVKGDLKKKKKSKHKRAITMVTWMQPTRPAWKVTREECTSQFIHLSVSRVHDQHVGSFVAQGHYGSR